ncbi:MAG TPA: RNB domain-containing ribonuclease [Methanospirillum sp.]|nr:RNB domain-containing ribonuclease [Methanospirillum sp.]
MKAHHPIDLKAIASKAMIKYGFTPEFPQAVIREVNSLKVLPLPDSRSDVRDLRSLLWSSIDNSDSMDLDQMEYCSRGSDGEILVKIAIADVDTYVPKQSRADRYASHNGTSVYTGIVTYPLLPDRLSKGITSLLPGQESRAIIIEYAVLPDGTVRHGEIYRAIVSNKAKLIYEIVGEWLEGALPLPDSIKNVSGLEEQLNLQNEAALNLKKYRRNQGALDLETLEAHVVMENEVVKDLIVQRQNMARCIIEEFMVAANGAMVDYLGTAGVPMIQRIVRTPKYWEEIRLVAASYDEKLPGEPDSIALGKFLTKRRIADPGRFPDLSLTIVKLMGSGEYVAYVPGKMPIGHFALAVTDYTHGTAPNRRYVDLIIQRLLKSVLDREKSPYRLRELEDQAEWLTGREKGSKKVERFMHKAAAAMLLHDKAGEVFDAYVTGASEKGTYVRLLTIPVEGRVMHGEHGLRVGQKVSVKLIKTDPENGFIDFEKIAQINKKH